MEALCAYADRGSIELVKECGGHIEVNRSMRLDWDTLHAKIQQDDMCNPNCVAIAPTATTSNIVGVNAFLAPLIHRRQPVPGAWSEEAGPVERGHGHGPQALRRFAAPIKHVPDNIKQLYERSQRSDRGQAPHRQAQSGIFVTADSLGANRIVLGTYRHITASEG